MRRRLEIGGVKLSLKFLNRGVKHHLHSVEYPRKISLWSRESKISLENIPTMGGVGEYFQVGEYIRGNILPWVAVISWEIFPRGQFCGSPAPATFQPSIEEIPFLILTCVTYNM